MTDRVTLERYADLLTGYCVSVSRGERVLLDVDVGAIDLARLLVRSVLRRGGEPFLRLAYPEAAADLAELASEELIASAPEVQLAEIRAMDAFVRVAAQENSRASSGVDPRRMASLEKRSAPVSRHRVERTRWVTTIFPTAAAAQEAGMSTDQYARFVYDSMFLQDEDPAARWRELGVAQQRLVDRLASADTVRIEGDGTDLTLRVAGRTWANSDGKRNMPSGEVYTSPLEESAQGSVRFTVPSSARGTMVDDVTLRFAGGVVVEATARSGQAALDAMLATDDGARRLGELGIGTNPNITRPTLKTLFDEKILGTIHLALGRSYETTGGLNASAVHWDLVCDLRREGRVTVDGEVMLEGGRLLWLD